MTADQHARCKAIFLEASALPPEDRAQFISRKCAGDQTLIREIERLLTHHLSTPPPGDAGVASRLSISMELVRDLAEPPTFQTGETVAGRYQIVSLLGEGAMGRVYRAEDSRLHQPVALKFLPRLHVLDPTWRRRVESEVKLSREVGHSNICRVYDLGEIDGAPFISMEYIDGEDLSSLLRRVGRLTGARAIDIARQICAGLAAAHIHGVLHRDLKPANIMIDHQGCVRITDFGLAVMSGHVEQAQIRAGTPRYMAPEQLGGIAVDEKSDIYSLGLVLYEMFTGRPAFDAESPLDYLRLHRSADPPPPSSIIPELDPAVEAVILACMRKDPLDRPESALNVAAALPGSDLLAAALDAGQIPTREMLAMAAARGNISKRGMYSTALAALVLLALAILLGHDTHPIARQRGVKSPEFLVDRALEVSKLAGGDSPSSRADGRYLPVEDVVLGQTAADQAGENPSLAVRPGEDLLYVYRESEVEAPAPGIDLLSFIMPGSNPVGSGAHPTPATRIILDGKGRLLLYESAAQPVRNTGGHSPDWQSMVRLSGHDPAALRQTEVETLPASPPEQRLCFSSASGEARIEIEKNDDRIRRFVVLRPSSKQAQPTISPAQSQWLFIRTLRNTVLLALLAVALPGAWMNWKNRGDLIGAARLGCFVLVLRLLSGLFSVRNSTGYAETIEACTNLAVSALAEGLIVALFYLAMETHVRRLWPRTLGCWSRLLAGRFRDSFVGRDILVGCAVGNFWAVLAILDRRFPEWMGWHTRTQLRLYQGLDDVLGVRAAVAGLFESVRIGIYQSLAMLLLLVIATWLAGRRRWLALCMTWLVGAAMYAPTASHPVTALTLIALGIIAGGLYLLISWGLVSLVSAILVAAILSVAPITTNLSAWYAGYGAFATLATLGIGLWGFSHSTRPPYPDSRPPLPL